MRRLLETGSDWLEGEKLFPFIISILYSGTWLGFFMSAYFGSNTGLEITSWLFGVVAVSAILIIIRFIQHVYGFAVIGSHADYDQMLARL
jgi:hypothetical protein